MIMGMWYFPMMILAVTMVGQLPIWHVFDASWQAKRQATVWMQRLRWAQNLAMVTGQSVRIRPQSASSARIWSQPLCIRLNHAADQRCWPVQSTCVGSTWPDRVLQFNPDGAANARQGRWYFGSQRSCCWQVVMSHAGRLRMSFHRDTLQRIDGSMTF